MKRMFLIGLMSLCCCFLNAQQGPPQDSLKLIQLSGVVVSSDSLNQMPFTTIFDRQSRRGTIADYYGFFSMVVFPGDTLMFSYYGYKTSSFIVPDTLTDNRYSIIHMMYVDTINLPMVTVYPWPSKEDFARAFVEMKPYDDALRRAQEQLSGENLAFAASRLSTDASLSFGWAQNQQNTRLYTMGQSPVNNLLNPYSWASFVQAWKAGKLARE
ncbi:MAG: hypothetical protein K0R65_1281 [Crocinitomicaceae bacterium]|jgi:hypothetical protein|nr:hypothetical protein [Crocinitomicaceae bacterium]